jgi:hypothetical protein
MELPNRTIVNIALANPGWAALYEQDGASVLEERQVAAWAFVDAHDELGSHFSRVGLIVDGARIVLADDPGEGLRFRGYLSPDEDAGRKEKAEQRFGFGHASSWFG